MALVRDRNQAYFGFQNLARQGPVQGLESDGFTAADPVHGCPDLFLRQFGLVSCDRQVFQGLCIIAQDPASRRIETMHPAGSRVQQQDGLLGMVKHQPDQLLLFSEQGIVAPAIDHIDQSADDEINQLHFLRQEIGRSLLGTITAVCHSQDDLVTHFQLAGSFYLHSRCSKGLALADLSLKAHPGIHLFGILEATANDLDHPQDHLRYAPAVMAGDIKNSLGAGPLLQSLPEIHLLLDQAMLGFGFIRDITDQQQILVDFRQIAGPAFIGPVALARQGQAVFKGLHFPVPDGLLHRLEKLLHDLSWHEGIDRLADKYLWWQIKIRGRTGPVIFDDPSRTDDKI